MIYDYCVPYDDIMLIMNDGKKVAVTSPRDIHALFFPTVFFQVHSTNIAVLLYLY